MSRKLAKVPNRDKVVSLIKSGESLPGIQKKTKLSSYLIKRVAEENKLKVNQGKRGNWRREDTQRNNKIVKLVEGGVDFYVLSMQFGITPQRIGQIVQKTGGFKVFSRDRQDKEKIARRIERDLRGHRKTVSDIFSDDYGRFSVNQIKRTFVDLFGCSINEMPKNIRNKFIIEAYSNDKLTADEILNLRGPILKMSKKLESRNMIYKICSISGNKKFKMIKNRRDGDCYESRRTLNAIVNLRNSGLSFQKISDELNNKGIKTVQGKKFSQQSVYYKYKKALEIRIAK